MVLATEFLCPVTVLLSALCALPALPKLWDVEDTKTKPALFNISKKIDLFAALSSCLPVLVFLN